MSCFSLSATNILSNECTFLIRSKMNLQFHKKNENTIFRGSIFQSIVNGIFSPGVVKSILYVVYVKFLYHRGFPVQKHKEKQR
jgi:hypothetical protein